MTARLHYLWYEFCYWVCFVGLTFGFSLRVRGRKNIPRTGPALLVANHQSYLDPPMVGMGSPRHLAYLARKTLFRNWLFGWLIGSLDAVPVDQEGVAKEGLVAILKELQKGRPVLIFPEGERTHGQMVPLRPGVLLLIKRAKAPVVPVGIAGAIDAWPRWKPLPTLAPLCFPAARATVAVSVGKPLDAEHFAKLPREQALRELFDVIHAEKERAERLRRK
jgi:1-acyl-sn-glycerol-3-phosphate acyltransferase